MGANRWLMTETVQQKKITTYAGYLSALACLLVTYPLVRYWTGQSMLSACLAAVAAIFGYLTCKLIQQRGRVTLAMAVIGFPLLMGMMFTAARQVAPLIKRQQRFELLSDKGISFRSFVPDKVGEWVQDGKGNMLPSWVANRIGPKSMHALFSIRGPLNDLQSLPYRSLDTSRIRIVSIDRDGRLREPSADFVQWLGSLPLNQLEFHHLLNETNGIAELVESSVQVCQELDQRFGENSGLRCTVSIDAPVVDLLTVDLRTVRSLGDLPNDSFVHLRALTLDAPAMHELAGQRHASIYLDGELPNFSRVEDGGRSTIDLVRYDATAISLNQCRDLVRIFRPKVLWVYTNATKEELATLWVYPELESIRNWDGRLVRPEKPADSP